MNSSKLSSVSESKAKPKSASKSPGKMMNQQKPSTLPEGVYSNGRFMHTLTSLVGNVAQIQLKDGSKYEGVLKTFSPRLDVVLESVIEVDKNNSNDRGCTVTSLIDSLNAKKPMLDTMVFEIDNIVSVGLLDVDLDYAFKDGFKTDTEITGARNTKAEKELVEWIDDTPVPKRGGRDDTLEPTNGQTGWSAQDMFAYNEKVNGVMVGYQGLDNVYTTAIDRSDPSYHEKARIAEKLANQILSNTSRTDVEDDDRGEEEKWSGVTRGQVSRPKESLPRPAMSIQNKKPSDFNWRDTNVRTSTGGEKFKQNKNPQESSPRQNVAPKNHNQVHTPKQVVEPHHYQPELNRKVSNPQVSRTTSKEQVDTSRPISFAAAVGQSEIKTSNQVVVPRPSLVTEVAKQEPVEISAAMAVQVQDKINSIESSKTDSSVLSKKSDATGNEIDSKVKTSTLNPNAKEFTLNPTAKPFTPKSHFSPPPQPLIANHPHQPNMAQLPFQPQLQQQQIQPHQQSKQHQHHHQASQYLVMNPNGNNMVMPHQQVIGPNGQPFQLLNPVVVNQMTGNHNTNQYIPGYNPGGSQPSRKSHHGPREPRQSSGHSRHENNSYNPHNVAAATGHPVLAGAPLTASGPIQFNHHHQNGPPGPGQQHGGGQPMFSPMFVQSYPRMFQPQMIGHPYDPQYFMLPSMVQSAVQPQQQQPQPNNGPHSTPSTPQSQTPSTPGLHGPSTPGPAGHAVIPQTPSPQQPGIMYPGQPIHGQPGNTFNPAMVMMQQPHPGLGTNPHLQTGQVMIPSSASGVTPGAQIPPHYNQNPPPLSQRPI